MAVEAKALAGGGAGGGLDLPPLSLAFDSGALLRLRRGPPSSSSGRAWRPRWLFGSVHPKVPQMAWKRLFVPPQMGASNGPPGPPDSNASASPPSDPLKYSFPFPVTPRTRKGQSWGDEKGAPLGRAHATINASFT